MATPVRSPFLRAVALAAAAAGLLACSGGSPPPKPAGPTVLMSDSVRKHLHPNTDMSALRRQALQEGLRPLRLAGAMKVAEGLTTMEEVLRSTPTWEN